MTIGLLIVSAMMFFAAGTEFMKCCYGWAISYCCLGAYATLGAIGL